MRRLLGGQTGCDSYQRIARLCDEFSRLTIYEIIKKGLHEFLDGIQARINEINDSIYTDFFALTPAAPPEVLVPAYPNA